MRTRRTEDRRTTAGRRVVILLFSWYSRATYGVVCSFESEDDMDRIAELKERFTQEPLGRAMGAELLYLEPGRAMVKVPVRDDFLIVDGFVQGGVTTTVADFAGVYAAMADLPSGHTPAGQIVIDFFRPIRAGETIHAHAKVTHRTRRSLWVDVTVAGGMECNGEEKAVARIHFSKPRT